MRIGPEFPATGQVTPSQDSGFTPGASLSGQDQRVPHIRPPLADVGSDGPDSASFVSGHEFTHAEKRAEESGALAPASQIPEAGFERARLQPCRNQRKKNRALAPEGRTGRLARLFLLPLLIAACAFTMGAASTDARYNDLGHKIMCTCGCNEILLECNHMGCQYSSKMTAELRTAVDRGDSDKVILTAFQDEYGPTALAAPWLTKFNIVAWVVPPLLLILGLAGTFFLVKKWRLRVASMPEVADDPLSRDLRERIRRETEI